MIAKTFEAKEKWGEELLRRKNVVGVMVGKKIVNGIPTDEDAVVILVSRKKPASQLTTTDFIPLMLGDVPTDVIEVGEIVAFQAPTEKFRPAPGGVSLGHYRVTAGTLGVTVEDAETGERLILSNNHVIALSNDAQVGDAILQPGPADGGTQADEIAKLLRYIPIAMQSGLVCGFAQRFVDVANRLLSLLVRDTRLAVVGCQQTPNVVDCALGKPNDAQDLKLEILSIGRPKSNPIAASVGMEVHKFGRTTGYTKDKVLGLEGTVNVSYGVGKVARFEHQIIVGPMSTGGDSGSLVLDMDNRPVGLLFAGSDEVTIINEIDRVVDALKIKFPDES